MMSFILSRVGEHTAVADDQQPRWHHHPPPQQHLSRELPLHPRVLLSVPGRLLLLPWDGVLCLQVNNPSVWPLTLKFNSSLQQFRLLLILCDDLFSWLKLQRGRYLNVFRQHCGIKLNHRRPVWFISHRIPPAANAAALLVTFSCICSSQHSQQVSLLFHDEKASPQNRVTKRSNRILNLTFSFLYIYES